MSAITQVKLLISLAQIDGKVAEREQNYIISVGKSNGLTQEEVEPLFETRHDLVVPEDLSDDERFDYLFSLVQLMKIDERMFKEEMMFCSKIAANLGYGSQAIFEFMLHVKPGVMEKDELINLKEITQKHFKKID
jgi:hypothetical protein